MAFEGISSKFHSSIFKVRTNSLMTLSSEIVVISDPSDEMMSIFCVFSKLSLINVSSFAVLVLQPINRIEVVTISKKIITLFFTVIILLSIFEVFHLFLVNDMLGVFQVNKQKSIQKSQLKSYL